MVYLLKALFEMYPVTLASRDKNNKIELEYMTLEERLYESCDQCCLMTGEELLEEGTDELCIDDPIEQDTLYIVSYPEQYVDTLGKSFDEIKNTLKKGYAGQLSDTQPEEYEEWRTFLGTHSEVVFSEENGFELQNECA